MAGKKGMKQKIAKEDSKRHAEYYKKHFPELTKEECEEKAKTFRKSCNKGNIEYWKRNYPNLTENEQIELYNKYKKELINTNPYNIEYYQTKYPELSNIEHQQLLEKFKYESSYEHIEYYIKKYPNLTDDERFAIMKEKMHIASKKLSEKSSGKNNGMHSSKTTQEQRNSISPRNIAFYERKYPDLSHEEHLKLQQDFFEKNRLAIKNAVKSTNIEYYLNQGLSYEDAYLKLKERQSTFTLEKCIKKYGEEIGHIKYAERQQKWIKSLQKNFKENGDGRSVQSKFAKDIIIELCKYFDIGIPKKEHYIYDNKNKRAYAYDFIYNYHIIEFNGDYWHCNPNIYDESYVNKVKKQTAKEIWEYDKIKCQLAEKYNNKILTIWESEYNENREKTIQKCIDFIKS